MTLEHLRDLVDELEGRLAPSTSPAAAVPAQRSSAAIALHAAGFTSTQELVVQLEDLGYAGERAERLVRSAALDRRRRLAELQADVLVEQLRDGKLDRATLQASLVGIGYRPDFAELLAELAWRRLPVAADTLAKTAVGLILLARQADARKATRASTFVAVRPASTIDAVVTLARQDTGARIPNAAVEVQLYDERIQEYSTIAEAKTGAGGQVELEVRAPAIAGFFRYRARFPGAPGLRIDTSPLRNVEVIT
jgi:hypothetical protein